MPRAHTDEIRFFLTEGFKLPSTPGTVKYVQCTQYEVDLRVKFNTLAHGDFPVASMQAKFDVVPGPHKWRYTNYQVLVPVPYLLLKGKYVLRLNEWLNEWVRWIESNRIVSYRIKSNRIESNRIDSLPVWWKMTRNDTERGSTCSFCLKCSFLTISCDY